MPSAARPAALWLLLWRCQPGQNKGRAETKQPQTTAPGRALTAKSDLAAEARAIALTVSHLHAESVYSQANIDLEK